MSRVLPPLAIGVASRVLLFGVVTLGLVYGKPVSHDAAWRAFPDNPLIDGWVRWDAAWYASIAREGYIDPGAIVPGQARNTVFFPLYPLSMRALTPLTGDVYLAGLLVSNLCFLAALVVLYRLVLAKLDRETAVKTTALVALNPYAIFFSAVYTESLFLVLVVSCFYLAEREQWLAAGMLAGLAGLTRVNGFLTAIALAMMILRKHRGRLAPATIVPILIGFAGPLSFLGYLWLRYGTPLEFVHGQLAAGWATTETFWPTSSTEARQWLFLLLSLVLSLAAWPRLGGEYGFWGAATSLTSVSRWASGGRYALVVFPASIVLARVLRNRYAFAVVLTACVYYLLRFALHFSHWRWVA